MQDYIKLIYYNSQYHKTLFSYAIPLKKSIKSELILNRPKQFIAKERELENSQLPEIQSAKKNSNIEQVYSRK